MKNIGEPVRSLGHSVKIRVQVPCANRRYLLKDIIMIPNAETRTWDSK